jgi:hypothetical protein
VPYELGEGEAKAFPYIAYTSGRIAKKPLTPCMQKKSLTTDAVRLFLKNRA